MQLERRWEFLAKTLGLGSISEFKRRLRESRSSRNGLKHLCFRSSESKQQELKSYKAK